MQGTLVSIVVPVYKVEKYIHKCLKSLQNQTYRNLEIILVDDGSPDECPKICDEYASGDDRIVVLHKQNGGLVSAWMEGVKYSKGEYICFVDSDDWVETNMVEELLRYTTHSEKEVVCSNIELKTSTGNLMRVNQLTEGVYEGELLEKNIKSRLLGNEERLILVSRCTKLFSRKLLEENLQYCDLSIKMGEDLNITLPVLLDSDRVVIIKQSFYHYIQHTSSMIHQYDEGMYENIFKLFHIIQRIMLDKQIENYKEQSEKEYIYLLLIVMRNELRSSDKRTIQRIKQICNHAENYQIIRNNLISIMDRANKMIYFVMRHPNAINIWLLKKIIKCYDIVKNDWKIIK